MKGMKGLNTSGLSGRVLKACGIFGGTQSVGILCSIVRSKLVAMWLGPAGFGLFAIFNSALDLLTQVSLMGVRSSAVRDVAAYAESTPRVARVITAVIRWGWLLSVAGALLTVVLSPLLSRWTFGDTDHAWSFVVLAVALIFNVLSGTRLAILQGMSRLRRLAKASLWGSIVGLAVSVPMFYLMRLDSVLPSILAYSGAMFLFALIYREKIDGADRLPRQSMSETIAIGKRFIMLGFFITLSDVLNQAAVYVFLSWLNHHASEVTVGYYQAGNTLFNRYVGMIFTAISMEYYPRLASAIGSPRRMTAFVSHEIKMVLALLVTVIGFFVSMAPVIVDILYMPDFKVIVPFVTVAIVGTTLRAVSWCMAMVILARGDGRVFLLTEGSSAIVFVVLNIVGYITMGLVGLGVAYVAWYVVYLLVVAAVYRQRYRLVLGRGIVPLIFVAVAIVAVTAGVTLVAGWWAGALMTVAGVVFSYRLMSR